MAWSLLRPLFNTCTTDPGFGFSQLLHLWVSLQCYSISSLLKFIDSITVEAVGYIFKAISTTKNNTRCMNWSRVWHLGPADLLFSGVRGSVYHDLDSTCSSGCVMLHVYGWYCLLLSLSLYFNPFHGKIWSSSTLGSDCALCIAYAPSKCQDLVDSTSIYE